jgi:two-component system LytT family sensor kinase
VLSKAIPSAEGSARLPRPSVPRPFWLVQFAGWGLFGAGMFVAGLSIWRFVDAFVIKASLTLFGFLASLLLRQVYRACERRGFGLPGIAFLAAPLSFGAAALWMAAHHVVLSAYATGRRSSPAIAVERFPDFTNTIYYFFVLVAWSVLYFGVQSYLDLARERGRLLRAEVLAHEARLRALRLQLSPHFLFNALNGVSTLVAESRNEEANRMLSGLAEFLRATLDAPERDEIPLGDEIEHARRYLEIEEIRFGERLRVDVSMSPDARAALVPHMILQPLVENAVRHAIVPRESGGEISIVATRREEWLLLGVHDDGPGISGPGAVADGVGLSNTRDRLAELYGNRAELSLSRSGRGGLAVSIRLPIRVAAAASP